MRKATILKAGLVVCALLATAVGTLPWWLPTGWLKRRLEAEARSALGTGVSIGTLSLFWTGAQLCQIRIDTPASFGPGLLAEISRVRVSASLTGLLSGQIEDLDLTIESPRVTLRQSTEGTWNAAGLGPPSASASPARSGTPSPMPAVKGKARIADGTVALFPNGAGAVALTGLSAQADVALSSTPLPGTWPLALRLSTDAKTVWGKGSIALEARSEYPAGNRLEIASVDMALGGVTFAGSGRIAPDAISFEGHATSLPNTLTPWVEQWAPAGSFSQRIQATGNAEEIQIRLEGSAQGLSHPSLALPPARLSDVIAVRWSPKTGALRIDEGRLDLSPPGLSVNLSGNLEASAVDLALAASLSPGAGTPGPGPDSLQITAGTLEAKAQVHGSPRKIDVAASIRGENLRLEGGPLPEPLTLPSIAFTHQGQWNPESSEISIDALAFESGFLSFTAAPGTLRWASDHPAIDLTLRATADADRLNPLSRALFPGLAAAPFPTGRLAGDVSVRGAPSAFSASASLAWSGAGWQSPNAPAISLGDLRWTAQTAGSLDMAASRLRLTPLRFTGEGLSIDGEHLSLSWADPLSCEARLPSIAIDLENTAIQTLASMSALPVGIGGKIVLSDLAIDWAGERVRTQGTLDLGPAGLHVKNSEGTVAAEKPAGTPSALAWEAEGNLARSAWEMKRLEATGPFGVLCASANTSFQPLTGALTFGETSLDLTGLAALLPSLRPFGISGTAIPSGSLELGPGGPRGALLCRLDKVILNPQGASPIALNGSVRYTSDPDADLLQSDDLSIETAGQKGVVTLNVAGIRRALSGQSTLEAAAQELSGKMSLALPTYAFQTNAIREATLDLDLKKADGIRACLSAQVNKGKAACDVTMQLSDGHEARLHLAQIDLDVADARLMALALPLVPAAGGRARFTIETDAVFASRGTAPAQLAESLRTPGPQTWTLTNGRIEGSVLLGALAEKLRTMELATLDFTKITQEFEIKDRRLINHLTRVEGDIPMEIRGWTNFDGAIDQRILIQGHLSEGNSQLAKIIRALNAAGGIRAHGAIAHPILDVDYETLAKKLLEEEIQSRRKDLEEEAKSRGGQLLEDLFKKKKKR